MIAIANHFCLGVQSKNNPQDALQHQNTNGEHPPPKVLQIPHRRVPQKGEGNEHRALINVDASGLSLRDHQPARQSCLQEGKWYRAVFIPVLQVTETQASFLRPINDSQSVAAIYRLPVCVAAMLKGVEKYAPEVSATVEKKQDSKEGTLHFLQWDTESPAPALPDYVLLMTVDLKCETCLEIGNHTIPFRKPFLGFRVADFVRFGDSDASLLQYTIPEQERLSETKVCRNIRQKKRYETSEPKTVSQCHSSVL
jgi:hypothetical protein